MQRLANGGQGFGTNEVLPWETNQIIDAVQQYNQTLSTFPTVMIAGFLGFQKRPYFEASAAAQEAPMVGEPVA